MDNLKLINKDFRTITKEDIPDGSVDLVLVLDFPEPRIREDEGGRQYQQLMNASKADKCVNRKSTTIAALATVFIAAT